MRTLKNLLLVMLAGLLISPAYSDVYAVNDDYDVYVKDSKTYQRNDTFDGSILSFHTWIEPVNFRIVWFTLDTIPEFLQIYVTVLGDDGQSLDRVYYYAPPGVTEVNNQELNIDEDSLFCARQILVTLIAPDGSTMQLNRPPRPDQFMPVIRSTRCTQ